MGKGMWAGVDVSDSSVKSATYTLTNLMTNTNFLTYGIYYNATQYSGPVTAKIPYTSDHKIYSRCLVDVSNVGVKVGIRFFNSSGTYITQYFSGTVMYGYTSSIGSNSTATQMDISIQNMTSTVISSIEYSKAVWIDLTACFGAGNEPSLAWCDANIPFFTGTTTLTVGGSAITRKVTHQFVESNNVARSVKQGWTEVNNVARRFFERVDNKKRAIDMMEVSSETPISASVTEVEDGVLFTAKLIQQNIGSGVISFLKEDGNYVGNGDTVILTAQSVSRCNYGTHRMVDTAPTTIFVYGSGTETTYSGYTEQKNLVLTDYSRTIQGSRYQMTIILRGEYSSLVPVGTEDSILITRLCINGKEYI